MRNHFNEIFLRRYLSLLLCAGLAGIAPFGAKADTNKCPDELLQPYKNSIHIELAGLYTAMLELSSEEFQKVMKESSFLVTWAQTNSHPPEKLLEMYLDRTIQHEGELKISIEYLQNVGSPQFNYFEKLIRVINAYNAWGNAAITLLEKHGDACPLPVLEEINNLKRNDILSAIPINDQLAFKLQHLENEPRSPLMNYLIKLYSVAKDMPLYLLAGLPLDIYLVAKLKNYLFPAQADNVPNPEPQGQRAPWRRQYRRPGRPQIDLGIQPRIGGFDNNADAPGSNMVLEINAETQVNVEAEREAQLQHAREQEQKRLQQKQREANRQERERAQQETKQKIKAACWNRAGNPWQNGGQRDNSFYHWIIAQIGRGQESEINDEDIQQCWTRFKAEHESQSNRQKTKKNAPKSQTQEKPKLSLRKSNTKTSEDKKSQSQGTIAPKHAEQNLEESSPLEIDWKVQPKKTNAKKKKHNAQGEEAYVRAQAHCLLRAADNEFLYLEGLFGWHNNIEVHEAIYDDILHDNIWYAEFRFFNALAEYNSLREIQEQVTDEVLRLDMPAFTPNHRDVRAIRNELMHGNPGRDILHNHCQRVLLRRLGPAIHGLCMSDFNWRDLQEEISMRDLASPVVEEINIDVNKLIIHQLEQINKYFRHLVSKEGNLINALRALGEHNSGRTLFRADLTNNWRHFDVFTVRAIESCLLRLGKLFLAYQNQRIDLQTLPATLVDFLRQVNARFRKVVAHEFDEDNSEWHFSPISPILVESLMRKALAQLEKMHAQEKDEVKVDWQLNAQAFDPTAN